MKLLHIIATPRDIRSATLPVSESFIDSLVETAQVDVDTVDLYKSDLPAAAGTNVEVKYELLQAKPVHPDHWDSWRDIEALIAQFLAADLVVITTPMWNFSIPYALKYYIDCLVQPGYLFRYDEQGIPGPLVQGKKMVIVTSRGGDYSTGPMKDLDFQEPYLRAIFGFVGVTDIDFVNMQPMDVSPELRAVAVGEAEARLATLASSVAARQGQPA